MCGIVGLVSSQRSPGELRSCVRSMSDLLVHRGPDEEGFWDYDGVYFGFRRLSILDINGGHQPMISETKNVIIFNGEIYNYLELRKELEASGVIFKTKTDTEVLLAAYEKFGEKCLERLNGMFAFAIWDYKQKKLFFARDRVGKKPLFFFNDKNVFAFASELKSLLVLPEVKQNLKIDACAVSDFLSLGYILTPKSIFQNIKKLPAGNKAWYDPSIGQLSIKEYWDLTPFYCDDRKLFNNQTRNEFIELFHNAVKDRLHSDVPLGSFLSGGIDSSSIVASMKGSSSSRILAYCIGFSEKSYDESNYAKIVSDHLGIDLELKNHQPMQVKDIGKLIWHIDEPFADTSIMPTYLLNATAREKVTVALSGDGGDELLAGYPTYIADGLLPYLNQLPDWITLLANKITSNLIRPSYKKISFDYKIKHFLRCKGYSPARAHYSWRVIFSEEEKRQIMSYDLMKQCQGYDPFDKFNEYFSQINKADFLNQTLFVDMKTWLQDDILVKADRMSMANSLEVRSPFLDHRLLEFCAQLDKPAKIQGFRQKVILKDTMKNSLPRKVLNRTKRGFNAPTLHFGTQILKNSIEFNDLFNKNFKLNSTIEDITYKSFALETLGQWLNIYKHFQKTGEWKAIANEN